MDERRPRRRYRGSLLGPVILIVLGIVFLLSNLGLVTGDIWNVLLNLWPVILIAIGLDGILRRQGLVGSTLLIGFGILFLLSNFGYLVLNVWQIALQLWPVLLIAIGFDIVLGRRRSIWVSLVGLLVVLVILAGSLLYFGVSVGGGQALTGTQISQPLEGVTQARVILEPAAGSLRVYQLSDSGDLIAGSVPLSRGLKTASDFSKQGNTATYSLRTSGSAFYYPGGSTWDWNLGLNPDIPIDLDVNLGAGNAELDLSGLNLSGFKMDMGVGKVTLVLPEKGRFQAKLDSAIGQLVVKIPRGMGARIKSDTGLANINVPPGFSQQGDFYTSSDYATAANTVDLDLGQAIGNITVEYLSR